ncbi:uncharacterized protein LOC123868144 [Maniola jurtina]|uniref:uncharacterized protein LOC123868144 n=1 Tax=Maniola jurtina TaxID=191418 RepID=UPI001E6893FA|nr:uncharacterized protein LOC123868144 [Maniola jurtina]XP_045766482.1 uncharacterized protein LOC123868144 [Maniola jurtina]
MPKCAFSCCGNRSGGANPKPGLVFYPFHTVPLPVREQWVKIVARERCNPNYKPRINSAICSEHFEGYEKSSAMSLYSTAIPTINIGPYDDTIIIEEECIGKDADLVCIIENQIPHSSEQPKVPQRNIYQDDDIVCVIENQIRTEPKPESTSEQAIDIEDQLQWSLVGTSKHFDGLLNLKGPHIQPPQQQTSSVEQESYLDDDVIIVEHEDSETESENEFKDQSSQPLKRPRKVETKKIIEEGIEHENNKAKSETEKEFNDQYSQFLRTYDKNLYNNKLRNTRTSWDRDKDGHKLREALMKPQNFTISTQASIAGPEQFETTTRQSKRRSPNKFATTKPMLPAQEQLKTTTHQSIPTAPNQFVTTQQPIPMQYQPTKAALKQFKTISQQSMATAPEQFTAITHQLIPTDPKQFVATTQQPIPVQLIKTSQLPTPQFTTTSQLATTPHIATTPQIATPVFATSSPLMVYDAASTINGTTQLVTLVPSNFSVGGVRLSSVVLNENNTKTYYLSNVLPSSTRLLFESDPIGEGVVTQQCLALNDNSTTNFLIKSEQDSEQFQPVIVKTENVSD